nr:hypothetical protein [uncultured Microbacterium sp.]
MIRPRFAAAALSAAVLGLTAVLVPTASIAEPVTAVPAASAEVIWADAADEFSVFAPGPVASDFVIPNEWQWTALETSPNTALGEYATFDANGLNSKDLAPLAIVHGLPAPVAPSDLASALADASDNAGANAQVGLFAQPANPDEPLFPVQTLYTVGGFNGADTLWTIGGNEPWSTEELAARLVEADAVVTGYFVTFFGVTQPPVDEETVDPPVEQPELNRQLQSELFTAPEGMPALRAAAVPGASGIASIRFGDLTTYFTPQPTATLTLERPSYTTTESSTTGITVSATGFAPGEVVTVGVGRGQSGDEVPGVTFVADADGNVSGTVVFPVDFVGVGDFYTLALVGSSSGQFASSPFAITAGGAPVAVPVSGEADYAG